jgi:hypothetical protein
MVLKLRLKVIDHCGLEDANKLKAAEFSVGGFHHLFDDAQRKAMHEDVGRYVQCAQLRKNVFVLGCGLLELFTQSRADIHCRAISLPDIHNPPCMMDYIYALLLVHSAEAGATPFLVLASDWNNATFLENFRCIRQFDFQLHSCDATLMRFPPVRRMPPMLTEIISLVILWVRSRPLAATLLNFQTLLT